MTVEMCTTAARAESGVVAQTTRPVSPPCHCPRIPLRCIRATDDVNVILRQGIVGSSFIRISINTFT
jgi:hypothetical protein